MAIIFGKVYNKNVQYARIKAYSRLCRAISQYRSSSPKKWPLCCYCWCCPIVKPYFTLGKQLLSKICTKATMQNLRMANMILSRTCMICWWMIMVCLRNLWLVLSMLVIWHMFKNELWIYLLTQTYHDACIGVITGHFADVLLVITAQGKNRCSTPGIED